jgi:hypothetical protein
VCAQPRRRPPTARIVARPFLRTNLVFRVNLLAPSKHASLVHARSPLLTVPFPITTDTAQASSAHSPHIMLMYRNYSAVARASRPAPHLGVRGPRLVARVAQARREVRLRRPYEFQPATITRARRTLRDAGWAGFGAQRLRAYVARAHSNNFGPENACGSLFPALSCFNLCLICALMHIGRHVASACRDCRAKAGWWRPLFGRLAALLPAGRGCRRPGGDDPRAFQVF